MAADPLEQFHRWRSDVDTDAVCLATAGADGAPSARMVLCKRAGRAGFEFHTNRESDKARDLAANPFAALVFFWAPDRQVRVTGPVTMLDDAESDAYWATRPRASQLGAWASTQSRPIPDRAALESRLAEVTERFADSSSVPRPPFWGGYRLRHEVVEYWTHRDDRLHERLRWRRSGDDWVTEVLSP